MTRGISIALATFNGERYLGAQLESLAGQTLKPCELVVFDDGSTDRTVSIAAGFARTAPFPVRIFEGDARLGYRRNFVRAAQQCAGDLISFCDQDDVWWPAKLELTRNAFDDPEVLLAFHNARLIDSRGRPGGYVFKPAQAGRIYAPLEIQPWMIVPGFSQMIRRSLLEFSGLHDHSLDMYCPVDHMPHDQWFMFLASIFGRTAYAPNPLADYRQHEFNTSGWLPARRFAYVAHSVSHAHYHVRAALVAVDNRIGLLLRLQNLVVEADAKRVDAALDYYRHLRPHVEHRLELYSSKSLRTRARSLGSLIRQGAYTRQPAGFGLDNLLLDICVGLPAGPMLRAH